MSETFKPFPCAECGGTVRLASARGEWREFRRGVRVHIPDDVLVPRCQGCGEEYLGEGGEARRGIAGVVALKPVGAVRPKARSAFSKPHAWPARYPQPCRGPHERHTRRGEGRQARLVAGAGGASSTTESR